MTEPAGNEDRAALHGLEERLFKLVSRKANPKQWREWLRAPLEHALAEGEDDLTLCLLKAGADAGAGWKGCDGRTMLCAAAEGGNEEVVSTLLEAGGLEELDDSIGEKSMTALHRAVTGGHSDAARALMLAGANVKLLDSRNRSPLHYAVEDGDLQLTEDIILAGADSNTKDAGGVTPLHLAAMRDNAIFLRTLLRRRARVNVANNKGQSPLHVAVERGRVGGAKVLLKAGADPNARYGGGNRYSPLFLARRNLAMTKILLEHGADVKSSEAIGCTALHWAADSSEQGVIEALVEAGANLGAKSSTVTYDHADQELPIVFNGMTPFHTAVYSRNYRGILALLHKGADINVKDDDGMSPLHAVCKFSALNRSVDVADFLLRRGADETVRDNNGQTAEDLIEGDGSPQGRLRRLLTNAQADRAWRRRGMLVMCRSRRDKVLGGDQERGASKFQCQASGSALASGKARSLAADGRAMLMQVVELEADAVFRAIIEFL